MLQNVRMTITRMPEKGMFKNSIKHSKSVHNLPTITDYKRCEMICSQSFNQLYCLMNSHKFVVYIELHKHYYNRYLAKVTYSFNSLYV